MLHIGGHIIIFLLPCEFLVKLRSRNIQCYINLLLNNFFNIKIVPLDCNKSKSKSPHPQFALKF